MEGFNSQYEAPNRPGRPRDKDKDWDRDRDREMENPESTQPSVGPVAVRRLAELNDRILELQLKLKEAQGLVDVERREKLRVIEQNNELNGELVEVRRALKDMQLMFFKNVQHATEQMTKTSEQRTSQVNEILAENNQLEQRVRELTMRLKTTEYQLTQPHASEDRSNRLQTMLDNSETALAGCRRDLSSAKEQIRALEQAGEEMRKAKKRAEEAEETMQQQVLASNQRAGLVESLRDQLTASQEAALRLREEIKAFKAEKTELSATIARKEESILELHDKLFREKEGRLQLQSEKRIIETELTTLQAAAEALRSPSKDSVSRMGASSSTTVELEVAKDEINRLKVDRLSLESSNGKKDELIEKLRLDLFEEKQRTLVTIHEKKLVEVELESLQSQIASERSGIGISSDAQSSSPSRMDQLLLKISMLESAVASQTYSSPLNGAGRVAAEYQQAPQSPRMLVPMDRQNYYGAAQSGMSTPGLYSQQYMPQSQMQLLPVMNSGRSDRRGHWGVERDAGDSDRRGDRLMSSDSRNRPDRQDRANEHREDSNSRRYVDRPRDERTERKVDYNNNNSPTSGNLQRTLGPERARPSGDDHDRRSPRNGSRSTKEPIINPRSSQEQVVPPAIKEASSVNQIDVSLAASTTTDKAQELSVEPVTVAALRPNVPPDQRPFQSSSPSPIQARTTKPMTSIVPDVVQESTNQIDTSFVDESKQTMLITDQAEITGADSEPLTILAEQGGGKRMPKPKEDGNARKKQTKTKPADAQESTSVVDISKSSLHEKSVSLVKGPEALVQPDVKVDSEALKVRPKISAKSKSFKDRLTTTADGRVVIQSLDNETEVADITGISLETIDQVDPAILADFEARILCGLNIAMTNKNSIKTKISSWTAEFLSTHGRAPSSEERPADLKECYRKTNFEHQTLQQLIDHLAAKKAS